MIRGRRLKTGNTIGLIAPATPEKVENIYNCIRTLTKLGFKIKKGKHLYDEWGYLAGKDKDRAYDLMNMFKDPEVDMILCVRGGYGTMRILPLIDYKIIKENPKIFMGFSDITTLLNEFALKCNLTAFHGPMGNSNFTEEETLKSFLTTLTKGYSRYEIKNPKNLPAKCQIEGIAEGQLVGGNLCLICSTLGTSYELDTKDKILFIEEIGESPYKVDRMLTQLLLANKLQQCRGFILGQFTDCDIRNPKISLTLQQVLNDRLLSLNKPTLSGFMSGHSYPKLTLPIGANIKLDCINGIITVTEPVVN